MNIAFFGIGLMGRPMVQRLMSAGHRLFLFNRTVARIKDLETTGTVISTSPAEALQQAECAVLMLKDHAAIEQVLFQGKDEMFRGKTVIQMGTILPEESRHLKQRIGLAGGAYFECPVLGSRDKAAEGELILMAGSTPEQFEAFTPMLRVLGTSLRRVGEVGQAAALKLALNQLIITEAAAFSLSLGMVLREGMASDDFMAILRESALYAPAFDKKLPRMLSGDFSDPNFPVRHMLKDVRLILEQARIRGLDVTLLQSIEKILLDAVDQGLGEQDYSAVFRVIQAGA